MNEHEKNASINYILAQGLVKPQTTWERVAEMTRTIGLRFIFWDMGYSIFFAAVTIAIALALFIAAPDSFRCSAAVGVAPLAFLVIMMFSETTEMVGGLYELKQTCRYTVRQITALRMLFYSLAGMLFTAFIVLLSARDAGEFLSLLSLCLSALFVCAVLGLIVLRFMRVRWAYAIYSAVWVVGNLALPFMLGEAWENTLRQTPLAISGILAMISAGILACQISKMLSEVKKYAVA